MTRNREISETNVLRGVIEALRSALPVSWKVTLQLEPTVAGQSPTDRRRRPDALIEIRAPDGRRGVLIIEAKRQIDPIDVSSALSQARSLSDATPLIVAPFLSSRTRDLIVQAGASYADATGNIRVALNKPALFLERSGAMANPWREQRPLRSLKGPAAGRAIRAFCDFTPPFGIRELAERSGTPVASIARVAGLLDKEALIERRPRGPIMAVDWPALLRRWTQDYTFTRSNRTGTFLEPRGLPALLQNLRDTKAAHSVTGSLAAAKLSPIAAPRLAAVYTESIEETSERLNLRAAETGGNVVLAEPYDPVVFERTWSAEDVAYAAPTQICADLLTGPGRGPAEAEELIRWMKSNEDAWRTQP